MPRVLLLATTTGYQTRAFGEAAERLGVDLVYATDRCHVLEDPWRDRAIPIRFYDEPASARRFSSRPRTSRSTACSRSAIVRRSSPPWCAKALGLPGHPRCRRRGRAQQAADPRTAARAGLPRPLVPADFARDRSARRWRPRVVSLRRQAARAVGQPRRHARRRRGRARRRLPPAARAACMRPTCGPSATRRATSRWSRGSSRAASSRSKG